MSLSNIPTNQNLLNRAILHSIRLNRLADWEAGRVAKFLTGVQKDLRSQIEKLGTDPTATRLADILRGNAKLIDAAWEQYDNNLTDLTNLVGKQEAQQIVTDLQESIPLAIDYRTPPPQVLRNLVRNTPLSGRLTKEWSQGLATGTKNKVNQAIRMGIANGESVSDIATRVRGVMQITDRNAQTIVRTAVNHTSQITRKETYKENSDVIKGIQYVATLDTRTSSICRSLDGKVFKIGDGPRPPQHMNCRSTTVPITKSWKELGIPLKDASEDMRASMNGQVPAKLTYYEWLRQQPKNVVEEVLGKKKAASFLKGSLPDPPKPSFKSQKIAPKIPKKPVVKPKPKPIPAGPATIVAGKVKQPKVLEQATGPLKSVAGPQSSAKAFKPKVAPPPGKKKVTAQTGSTVHTATAGKQKATGPVVVPAKAPPPPPPPPPAKAPALPGKMTGSFQHYELDENKFVKTRDKLEGSNPGYFARDENGVEWLLKFPKNEEFARNEVLAANFYRKVTNDVPEVRLVRGKNGKIGVASRVEPGLRKDKSFLTSPNNDAHELFATDAFLANWDVVGLEFDNMLVRNGRPFRIDTGGALRFRATGPTKGRLFSETVGELETLQNPNINPEASRVFAGMSKAQKLASMNRTLDNISEIDISRLVDRYGPNSPAERASLKRILQARRNDLRAKRDALVEELRPKPIPSQPVTKTNFEPRFSYPDLKNDQTLQDILSDWQNFSYSQLRGVQTGAINSNTINPYDGGRLGAAAVARLKKRAGYLQRRAAGAPRQQVRGLYRGMNNAKKSEIQGYLQVGNEIELEAMSSFTQDLQATHSFRGGDINEDKVSLLFKTRSRLGLDVNRTLDFELNDMADEEEFILPKGARFRVLSVTRSIETGPTGRRYEEFVVELESLDG